MLRNLTVDARKQLLKFMWTVSQMQKIIYGNKNGGGAKAGYEGRMDKVHKGGHLEGCGARR